MIGVFDDFDAKLPAEEDGLTIRKRWALSFIEKNPLEMHDSTGEPIVVTDSRLAGYGPSARPPE